MKRSRVGVCGLGSIGCRHARLLVGRGDVDVFGFDAHGVAETLAPQLDGVRTVTPTFEALLECELDALVVATPDRFHLPQASAALHAGVPVLVEKPVAESLAAARQLRVEAIATGVSVVVGYVLRHHATMRRVQEAITAGAIGVPVSVHASVSAAETITFARNRFADDVPFRLVYDYSHEWDYLQWMFGPVTRCAATAATAEGADVVQRPNSIETVLDFAGGVVGTVHLDYVRSDAGRWAIVVGDAGTLRVDVQTGVVEVATAAGTHAAGQPEPRDDAFVRQLDHLLSVAHGDTPPLATVDDGVRAIAVAEAVRSACETGTWQTPEPVGERSSN